MMKAALTALWRNDGGQDLVEYSLLVAFIMVASAALLFANGGGIQGILFVTTTNLNAANQAAS
jgi:Flp pilus assembly pilin Flp